MNRLKNLFDNNRAWSAAMKAGDAEFFTRLTKQQAPEYLWIGCADSRVPANTIIGLVSGEVFVHRNVANLVVHTDLNCLSVIQFAVDVLKVKHIIVCGHYGCGGVKAAVLGEKLGLIDNWLRHIQDTLQKHEPVLRTVMDSPELVDRMCELNVIEQVMNVSRTTIVQDAWARGQSLSVHGWIYGLNDGLLKDLGVESGSVSEADTQYQSALKNLL